MYLPTVHMIITVPTSTGTLLLTIFTSIYSFLHHKRLGSHVKIQLFIKMVKFSFCIYYKSADFKCFLLDNWERYLLKKKVGGQIKI